MRYPIASSLLVLGTVLSMGAVHPAIADVHQMGSVNVAADHYTHVSWTRFDGPVARLSFIPDNDAVDCDHITVTYRDGTSHDVFSGTLLRDQRETISFPDTDSRLRSVDFACRARNLDGARISLSAISGGEPYLYPDRDADLYVERPAHLRTFETAAADER